eukprot:Platyproteum_vivax@DN11410_c0_g1_i1.p1
MPRGGHSPKAQLFPICGEPIRNVYCKLYAHGLYHSKRDLFFRPHYGRVVRPLNEFERAHINETRQKLRKRENYRHTVLLWEKDSHRAFKTAATDDHTMTVDARTIKSYNTEAYINSERQLLLPNLFTKMHHDYLWRMVEWNVGQRSLCGLSKPEVVFNDQSRPVFKASTVDSDDMSASLKHSQMHLGTGHLIGFLPSLDQKYARALHNMSEDRFMIRKLWNLAKESDCFREMARDQLTSETHGPFPYINENTAYISPLKLSNILFVKNHLRLANRRHPKWMDIRYVHARARSFVKQIIRTKTNEVADLLSRKQCAIASNARPVGVKMEDMPAKKKKKSTKKRH